MSKTFRDEELTMVFLCQFYDYMLTIGGRTFADINSHIKYCTFDAADEFTLREGRTLEMQTSHHTITRLTFVVLHKSYWTHLLVKLTL